MHATLTKPAIAHILGDERWYADGPPRWHGAPTAETAQQSRVKLTKRLRRMADEYPGASDLAEMLASCSPGQRCLSGACPECTRALQRWTVSNVKTVIRNPPFPMEAIVAISVVFPDGRTSIDRLDRLAFDELIGNLFETFAEALVRWAALAIDISLNDDSAKGFVPGFQLQLYGTASTRSRQRLSKRLCEKYRPSPCVSKAIQIKHSDESRRAISYTFKVGFVRRVSYWGKRHSDDGQIHNCWHTRKVSLRAREEVVLRLWLHKISLAERIRLYNLDATMSYGKLRLSFRRFGGGT
jgi:hypothetical protein